MDESIKCKLCEIECVENFGNVRFGRNLILEDTKFYVCPKCEEIYITDGDLEKLEKLTIEFLNGGE